MEMPFDLTKWYIVVAALQPWFSVDDELALELRSRVRRLHCAAPRPFHTRARLSAAAKAFRCTIAVRGGRCQWQQARTKDISDATSQRILLPQSWGRRATLVAPGDQSRGLRSSRKTVLTKDERGAARNGRAARYSASDGRDWLALAPDLVC